MRVIAGKYRSRKLQTLRGLALRPSSDRLRETLFNIIGPDIEDSIFVDLFAGSGAVGIEALSRGARHAFFIEKHPAGTALLRRNLESLGIAIHSEKVGTMHGKSEFAGTAEIISLDAIAALERLTTRGVRVDIVFADPPYADSKAYTSVLEELGDCALLARSASAILEHNRRRELPPFAGQLERRRVVQQGDAALTFYKVVLAA
jgi:16S rRNA (guanine966-N2)-methyltransferase